MKLVTLILWFFSLLPLLAGAPGIGRTAAFRGAAAIQGRPVSGGGPFVPPAGLRMRFESKSITAADGDSVSTWPDSSGNGFDLTSPDNPPYFTNSVAYANNQPAVVAIGSKEERISINTTNVIDGDKQTVFVVIFGKALTDNQKLFYTIHSTGRSQIQAFSGDTYYDSTDTSGGRLVDASEDMSGFHLWVMLRTGSVQKIIKDGNTVASSSSRSGTLAEEVNYFYLIGSFEGQGQWFEAQVYNVALSDVDIATVSAYLKSTYGTP